MPKRVRESVFVRTVDRETRFASPSERRFRRRLAALARRHEFRVVRVRFLRPVQTAPDLVIEGSDPARLTRAIPEIVRTLDRPSPTADDRLGWVYEGFLLEARDGAGAPFAAVFNFWRGGDGGGGQWAREEALYPFEHGHSVGANASMPRARPSAPGMNPRAG